MHPGDYCDVDNDWQIEMLLYIIFRDDYLCEQVKEGTTQSAFVEIDTNMDGCLSLQVVCKCNILRQLSQSDCYSLEILSLVKKH